MVIADRGFYDFTLVPMKVILLRIRVRIGIHLRTLISILIRIVSMKVTLEENYDEARRAAYVLEQMWPDADVSSVFEEHEAELY